MLKKQISAILLIICLSFLGGCQKSIKQQQKTITHLNAQTADFASNTADDLCVYAKICDTKENRYYFGKRKLPFNVLKMTFDNQSKTDYTFDPKASHFALANNKKVAKAIHPRARGAYVVGLIPTAMAGALTATTALILIPSEGFGAMGYLIVIPIYGVPILAGIGIVSSLIYKGIHHRKNKKTITKNVDKITQLKQIPAGQKTTTFLFLDKEKNNLSQNFNININRYCGNENEATETPSNILMSSIIN